LNQRSEAGWALLVEGKRDENALRGLGYRGVLVTVSSHARMGSRAFGGLGKVVILTDLDREGGTLAARFMKSLIHEGFQASLAERKRLKSASKGVFLHIENLSRFFETVQAKSL
jgi:5S rRNA maturation endonuclease (ribonuclease M5)